MTRVLNRLGLVLVLWLTLAGVARADVITVTRNDDRVGGTCTVSDCTLREAIAFAQPGDTVQLGGTPSAVAGLHPQPGHAPAGGQGDHDRRRRTDRDRASTAARTPTRSDR